MPGDARHRGGRGAGSARAFPSTARQNALWWPASCGQNRLFGTSLPSTGVRRGQVFSWDALGCSAGEVRPDPKASPRALWKKRGFSCARARPGAPASARAVMGFLHNRSRRNGARHIWSAAKSARRAKRDASALSMIRRLRRRAASSHMTMTPSKKASTAGRTSSSVCRAAA